ncbi:NAD-dependent epimerase/dehydratase family protein [Nitrospirillum sp. BR 11752]|uniref:NAD-dependent epimerase/dehydratase family protein n=1 Tax=Nitrospirillum sp. BR 11752 TaxID=3104293 RepID=UPI003FA57FE9
MSRFTVITGGAGFIGTALSHQLSLRSKNIVAIDSMHPQVHRSSQRPKDLHPSVELVVMDIRDRNAWRDVFARYEIGTLIHLAAETGTGQSLGESARHAGVNVFGTTVMLDALSDASIIPDHIILASSRAVYGEGAWRSNAGVMFYPESALSRSVIKRALGCH